MPLSVTTLRDVFKTQVKDSVKVPTIWVDIETGTEYEDYDHTYISSKNPYSYSWSAARDELSYLDKVQLGMPEILFVRGTIKQVGSHVKFCGYIYDRPNLHYPFIDNLSNLFKYAINLEKLNRAFSSNSFGYYGGIPFEIPEDLLWGCPNLIDLSRSFALSSLEKIPSNLLAKCPKLQTIQSLFYASEIKEIPEDLFKNNQHLINFKFAFANTQIEKVPDKLFDPVMDGILNGSVDVSACASSTPVSAEFTNVLMVDAPKTAKARKEKRDKYLPKDMPREIQWRLIDTSNYNGANMYF